MTQTSKKPPAAPPKSTDPIENVASYELATTPTPYATAPAGTQTGTYQFATKEFAGDPRKITSYEAALEHQAASQPIFGFGTEGGYGSSLHGRTLKQFGANFLSGFGQGLANLTDVASWGNDNYQSTLLGHTTKEMQDWTQAFNEKNKVYEYKPGEVNLTDLGWWANQGAQAGTGMGMGALSVIETGLIEASTFGTGSGVALARLGATIRGIVKGAQGVERATEALNIARGMKSAATIYGILNRTNESRMEAMQSHAEIYEEMKNMRNADGSLKYTDEQAKKMADEGADITFGGNMALLPLDILSYRAMVFNPATGAGEGILERFLAKAPKAIGKPVGWALGTVFEGAEEGGQFIFGEEGKHYARTLGGMDDGSSFAERVGSALRKDEFWNNVAGGIIGAPVMGGMMWAKNKVVGGGRTRMINGIHQDYIKNVGKMDNTYATEIKKAEAAEDYQTATNLRFDWNRRQALAAKHWDARVGKDTAYSSRMTFLEGTLEELKQGKFDALNDLNINIDPTNTEQIEKIKADFTEMIEDSKSMGKIYDDASNQYEQSILPSVVNTKFNLTKEEKGLAGVKAQLATHRASLPEFNELSSQGRDMYEIMSQLPVLDKNRIALKRLVANTTDPMEKANHQKVLDQTTAKMAELNEQKDAIESDDTYTNAQREQDFDLNQSILTTKKTQDLLEQKTVHETQITLARKQLGLYNNAAYVRNQRNKAVASGKANQATTATVATDPKETAETRQAAQDRLNKEASDRMQAAQQQAQQDAKATVNAAQTEGNLTQGTTPVSQVRGNGNLMFPELDEETEIPGGAVVQDAFTTMVNVAAGTSNEEEFDDPEIPEGGEETQQTTPGRFEDEEGPIADANVWTRSLAPLTFKELDAKSVKVFADGVNTAMTNLPADRQGFRDLLDLFIKVKGKEEADRVFNGLKRGWQALGRPPEDFDAIYNEVFTSVADAFSKISEEVRRVAVAEENKKIEVVVAATGTPIARNEKNQPVYREEAEDDDTDKPLDSTMAFTNTAGEWKYIEDEKGVGHSVFVPTEEGTIFGTDIDNRPLLDPDKFTEGTEVVALIPPDPHSIIITVRDPSTGEKIKSMPFGQWMSETGAVEGSPEWIDKVPMIIYEKGKPNQKGVAFVHDTDWYHIFKYGSSPEENELKQNKTRAIRQAVAGSVDKSAELVVTFKTQTSVRALQLKGNTTIPFSQANTQVEFVVAGHEGELTYDGDKNIAFPGKRMLHPGNTRPGQFYAVIRYGTQHGQPTYLLQKFFPQALGETQAIGQTLKNFASLTGPGRYTEAAKKATQEIERLTGIDVKKAPGIVQFLKQFVAVETLKGAQDMKEARNQIDHGKNNIVDGKKYVAVLASGRIVFGVKGEKGFIKEIGSGTEGYKAALEFADHVKDLDHNVGLDAIRKEINNSENQVVYISYGPGANGVEGYNMAPQGSYSEYLKTKLNSNLKSINIGTADKPNFVSQTQPTIGIELKANYKPKVVTTETTVKTMEEEKKKADQKIEAAGQAPIVPVVPVSPDAILMSGLPVPKDTGYISFMHGGRPTYTIRTTQGTVYRIDVSEGKASVSILRTETGEWNYIVHEDASNILAAMNKKMAFTVGETVIMADDYSFKATHDVLKDKSYLKYQFEQSVSMKADYPGFEQGDFTSHRNDVDWPEILGIDVSKYMNEPDQMSRTFKSPEMEAAYYRDVTEAAMKFGQLNGFIPQTEAQPIVAETTKTQAEESEEDRKAKKKADRQARIAESLRSQGGDLTGRTESSYVGTVSSLSPPTVTDTQRLTFAESINRIEGLTSFEQIDVINFIYQQMVKMVMTTEVTKEQMEAEIKKVYDKIFQKFITDAKRQIEGFTPDLTDEDLTDEEKAESQRHINGQQARINKVQSILDNFDMVYKEVDRVVKKKKLITDNVTMPSVESDEPSDQNPDDDDLDIDTPSQREWGGDSLRVNPQLKVTAQLKLLMEGVEQIAPDGTVITGSFGVHKYVSADDIVDFLQESLINVPPSRKEMMEVLNGLKTSKPWMAQVIAKLNEASEMEKKMFLKAMANNPHRPKFILWTLDKRTNAYTVKIMDSHLNGLEGRLWTEWKNKFKTNSGVVVYADGKYRVDQGRIQEFINRLKSFADLNEPKKNVELIRTFFHDLGVVLDPRSVETIVNGKFTTNYKEQSWRGLFAPGGLFTVIEKELIMFRNAKDEDILQDKGVINNGIFKSLAKEEALYSAKSYSTNFRENGKSYFGKVTPKYILDTAVELSTDESPLREELGTHAFSKNSFILKLLNRSSKFRQQFSIDPVGDQAIKLNGKKSYSDDNVTALPPQSLEATKLGGFEDMQQGGVEYENDKGKVVTTWPNSNIALRIAMMFMPPTADKTMALWMKTAVFDFTEHDLLAGTGITDQVAKLLYDQLVKPELLRMIDASGETANISGYDKGKHLFFGLSGLNAVMYGDMLLTEHLKNNGGKTTLTIEELEANQEVMDQVYKVIRDTMEDQADKKVKQWLELGLIEVDDKDEVTSTKNFDGANPNKVGYLSKFKNHGKTQQIRMAAMDYTMNSMVHNMNVQMIATGDPAMYYKSKAEDPTQINMDTYDNSNKRYAGLIAPAIPYPDGTDQKFVQIMMEDKKSLPEPAYLKMVTRLQDGKEITDKEIETLKGKDTEAKDAIMKKFPKSNTFFEIEGTDAQEYTTWKEHLDILEAYAQLPGTVVAITTDDLKEARRIFRNNIDRKSLSEEQLIIISKVLQPIKPRYFGRHSQQYLKGEGDSSQKGALSRIVYIKTSSFPLIPQLTEGFEIDKLRKLMEDKQAEGYNVRASYQSGNKVGAVNKALKVWNDDGTFNPEAKVDDTNSLVLSRKGWGIQQEVPFKSKEAKEDKVRVMTQLMKLMFGDGIMEADGFHFEGGKPKSGREMQKIYNELFLELFDMKRNDFNNKLGLEGYGTILDSLKTSRRLQKLLKEEAVKRGYPLNDIVGLGLDEQGNFNMPLWASANVNRFESLLNSIVDNAMVKIKFPGYSYVAGTSEGFVRPKVTEEQDAEVKSSEMIYTKHWNGDKLQMTFTADGKLHKAQVFLPSKFKDANGKLVDLFKRGKDNEYIYVVEKKGGGFDLKPGAIDDELLSILTCRIPTSSLASAATVEIAGFIPANSGDLVIVPSEFTKQKGMDFDVDKEYSYHYHHVVGADGKISKVDKLYEGVDINELIKEMEEAQPALYKELGLERRENRKKLETLQAAIDVREEEGLEPIAATMEKIAEIRKKGEDKEKSYKDTFSVLAELKEHREKMLVNRLINLMQSVMENPSDHVQSRINKALTIEYEKDQAKEIDKLNQRDNSLFTGLSDMYQTDQFMSGVAGKIGTAIYSLDVVFHSQAQQSALNGQPVFIERTWAFGDIVSHSEFGKQQAVSEGNKQGDRSITEVNSGRQNASVDNGKEKTLGKVNLNPTTMDVDKILNLLGLDKADGKRIADYFFSQPIIKDYVRMMQNTGGIFAEYVADKEDAVYKALMAKYYPEHELLGETPEEKVINEAKALNIRDMAAELSKNPAQLNGQLQMRALDRFVEMRKYGLSVRKIQVALNTDSKGLNKSFFNVIERIKTLDSLPDMELIKNAKALVGDYVKISDLDKNQIADHKRRGYIQLPIRSVDAEGNVITGGKYLIKPTTISGKVSMQSLLTAYNLYNNYLPYDSIRFNQIFAELLPAIQGKTPGEGNTVEMKQEILQEIKKYLGVANGNGIIYGENLADYRRELYIDSADNISLAKYIRELMDWKGDDPIINEYIKKNTLLQKMEMDIRIDGTPSRIKYNNATGESFDEQELHNAFFQLLSVDHKLPRIGNKQYTTAELAQAMITYSHLGNMIQEAIQFTKFIPAEYYNQVNYTTFMKTFHAELVLDQEDHNLFKINAYGDTPSRFSIQYAQHNPSRIKFKLPNTVRDLLPKIVDFNPEYGQKVEGVGEAYDLSTLTSFKLEDKEQNPKFITIYNKNLKGDDKQQLYVKFNEKYVRVPILGTFGMDEYDPSEPVAQTIVNDQVKADLPMSTSEPKPPPIVDAADPYNLTSNNIGTVIESVAAADLGAFSNIAKQILPNLDHSTKIEVKPIFSKGTYTHDTNTVAISVDSYQNMNKNDLAKLILHETIHSITINQIKKYLTSSAYGVYQVKEGAPNYVHKMLQLYNEAEKQFGQEKLGKIRAKIDRVNKGIPRKTDYLEEDEIVAYGATDIFEFMTMIMTEPQFQEELKGIKFKATNETFFERFMSIMHSILQEMGVQYDEKGITAQAITTVLELIEDEAKTRKEEKSKYQLQHEAGLAVPTGLTDAEILYNEGYTEPMEDLTEEQLKQMFGEGPPPDFHEGEAEEEELLVVKQPNLLNDENKPVMATIKDTEFGKIIMVDPTVTLEQFRNYLFGEGESQLAKQRQAVIAAYAKDQKQTVEETKRVINLFIKTPEMAQEFLSLQWKSYDKHNVIERYYRHGLNLMTLDKIDAEVRAVKEAMNTIIRNDSSFSPATLNSFPDIPLKVKTQHC